MEPSTPETPASGPSDFSPPPRGRRPLRLALRGLWILTLLTGVVGCGQGYSPTPDQSVPSVQGGGDVFGNNGDGTVYKTASYEVLRYTLTNAVGIGTMIPQVQANSAAVCGTGIAVAACPKAAPVDYIDANRTQLGTPVYNQEDPLATQAPTQMTSAGFKTWVLAASSACGRMMIEEPTPALFPNGVADYTFMYQTLIGRSPNESEISTLDNLRTSLTTAHAKCTVNGTSGCDNVAAGTLTQLQGTAVCTSVLGSMEFLTVN